MVKQQQLQGRPFAVLIMSAINWPVIRPHILKISPALDEAQPGTFTTIDCGVFIARVNRQSEEGMPSPLPAALPYRLNVSFCR